MKTVFTDGGGRAESRSDLCRPARSSSSCKFLSRRSLGNSRSASGMAIVTVRARESPKLVQWPGLDSAGVACSFKFPCDSSLPRSSIHYILSFPCCETVGLTTSRSFEKHRLGLGSASSFLYTRAPSAGAVTFGANIVHSRKSGSGPKLPSFHLRPILSAVARVSRGQRKKKLPPARPGESCTAVAKSALLILVPAPSLLRTLLLARMCLLCSAKIFKDCATITFSLFDPRNGLKAARRSD